MRYRLKNKQEMKRKEVEFEIDELIEERNIIAEQKVRYDKCRSTFII